MLRFARNKLPPRADGVDRCEGDGNEREGGVRPSLRRPARRDLRQRPLEQRRSARVRRAVHRSRQGDRRPARPSPYGRLSVLECRTVSSRRELDGVGSRSRIGSTRRRRSFIPPLRQQLRDFHARRAPYFRFGDIELLSVVRDQTVVARTTAHTNAKLDAKLGERQLLFGFTEFVDDGDVFAELVGGPRGPRPPDRRHALVRAREPPAQSVRRGRHVGVRGARVRRQPLQPRVLPRRCTSGMASSGGSRGRRSCFADLDQGDAPVEELFPFDEGASRARAAGGQAREQTTHEEGARLRSSDAERELRAAGLLHRDRRGRVRVPGGGPRLPDRRADRALPVQGRRADRVRPLRAGHLRLSCGR